jgi:hypothetical protein
VKTIAISQSNYVPWKGFFDLINSVDEFILYDDVQYTRRDWRNRNLIKTPAGLKWLTIPILSKGRFEQKIEETRLLNLDWTEAHWAEIATNYAKAPFFNSYRSELENLYKSIGETHLSQVNFLFLSALCKMLQIRAPFRWSHEFTAKGDRSERLLAICLEAGASVYYSGPSARDYLDVALFNSADVEIVWMDYTGYPTYRQQYGPFEHCVSVLDLLLNEGPNASHFMKSFTSKQSRNDLT